MAEPVVEELTTIDYTNVLQTILDTVTALQSDLIGEEDDEKDSVSEDVGQLRADLGEVKEMIATATDRPFLSTPLEEYSVTEGLLLMILFVMFLRALLRLIKEGFFWLWS